MSNTTKRGDFKLIRLMGLDISAAPSAIVGTLILWLVLSTIGYWLIGLTLPNAIIGGLAATLLHHVADLCHQLGHAVAARNVGHPMTGIRFGFLGVLSTSIYPPDEGELPPTTHLRRAWGGPLGSLVLSIVAAVIFLLVNTTRSGGTVWWLALFFFLDNFVLFTLEAFLPLGFNDGSTIRRWREVQNRPG